MQVVFPQIPPFIYKPSPSPAFQADESHISQRNRPLKLRTYEECSAYISALGHTEKPDKAEIKKLCYMFNDPTGHFSIDKASAVIKSIIDKQLMLYSEQDIKNVISAVQQKHPDISKEIILKELSKLSSFSNYDSLNVIEKYIEQNGIDEIYKTSSLSVNNVFDYLASSKKEIIKMPNIIDVGNEKKSVIFVDRNTIEWLKELKEKNSDNFKHLKNRIYDGKTKLAILDGWEAKTKNGFRSFNIIGRWGNLAETVSDIIQTKKEHTNSPYITDIVEDLKTLFEDDEIDFDIIKNDPENVHCTLSDKEIANRLNSKTLSIQDIKDTIFALSLFIPAPKIIKFDLNKDISKWDYEALINCAGYKKSNIAQQEKMQKLLAVMFALNTKVYSPRRLAKEIKELDKKISDRAFYYDKPKENLVFIVPWKEKSYGLINYQYSKVNGIPISNYVYANKEDLSINIPDKKNKVFVLLDDFSGSGHSMLWELFPYRRFKYLHPDEPLIFSSIVYTDKAQNAILDEIDRVQYRKLLKDSFVGITKVENMKNCINELSHRYKNPIDNFVDTGYLDGGLSLAFAHVIPDNCSDISGLLLENMLKNPKANKAKMDSLRKETIKRTIDVLRRQNADQ